MQHASDYSEGSELSPIEGWERFKECVRSVVLPRKKGPGRPSQMSLSDLLISRVYRTLCGSGAIEHRYEELSGRSVAGSGCSRQLRKVDDQLLQQMNAAVLRPVADPERFPAAFWKGWRLGGIDGTTFALQNTEQILEKVPKSRVGKPESKRVAQPKGQRKKVAAEKEARDGGDQVGFPRIEACALVELGTHAPLAAHIGLHGEGELTLGFKLINHVSEGMLVLADRLYGRGAFVYALHQRCREVNAAFLVKIPSTQSSRLLQRLSDGSALVEVKVRSDKRPADIVETFTVREITYAVSTTDDEGNRIRHDCRVWTNLQDALLYPAEELAELMAKRWEHEILYKEAKSLCPREYLDSQLLETAAVEIMSLLWVSALLAQVRAEAATPEMDPHVSFSKTQETVEKVVWLLTAGGDILNPEQVKGIVRKAFCTLQKAVSPPRRNRRCPRKVRRQQKHWPKLRRRTQSIPDTHVEILQLPT